MDQNKNYLLPKHFNDVLIMLNIDGNDVKKEKKNLDFRTVKTVFRDNGEKK